ncbi:FdtA/QdtA family cupin domain-containing protein [Nocardioides sp.]|uniref:sugar 3,4-ketoisomerase n=1 Tax=Nocardioides sp. TaxID=35761 RepID=UPI003569D4EE
MTLTVGHLDLHRDARGALLPVEAADLPFPIARVFVVTGTEEGVTRGGHPVPCRELMVVLSGSARVRLSTTAEAEPTEVVLDRPGAYVDLPVGHWITYDLAPGPSTIMVLADAAYEPESS